MIGIQRNYARVACTVFVIFATVASHSCAAAQSASVSRERARDTAALPPLLKLKYDDPITYAVGKSSSGVLADVRCSSSGSVYVELAEDTSTAEGMTAWEVLALSPTGSIVRYTVQNINGYRNVHPLLGFFVSGDELYLTFMADKVDPLNPNTVVSQVKGIQVFDHTGSLERTILLEPGVEPLRMAVLASGDLLIVSTDRLQQASHFYLYDSHGTRLSDWQTFDRDFAAQLATSLGQKTQAEGGLRAMLQMAALTQHGENILLAVTQANLPLVEFNEHGVLRDLKLALPPNTTFGSLIPTDDVMLYGAVGGFQSIPAAASTTGGGSAPAEYRMFQDSEINEFYPQDGSLFRRVAITPGLIPACVSRGDYVIFTQRDGDFRLQVTHARPITQ